LLYTTRIYRHFDRTSWLASSWISPERAFVNARFTWQLPDQRSTLALWGRNLTGHDGYIIGGVPLASNFGLGSLSYAPPRTFGLDFSYRFGD
jgi:outer membrane receptor protein involved in Fe transport